MQQQDTNPISNFIEKKRAESIKMLSLLGAIGSWLIVTSSLYLQLADPRYSILLAISTIMAICLTIANFLAHQNKLNLARWLFILATEINFITISYTIANLGIILSIILMIVIGNLTLQSLTSRKATIAITTGIISSIIILLIDILSLNHLHIILEDWQIKIVIMTSGVIILIQGMELLTYYQFNSVRSQISAAFVIISIVPLWTITILLIIGNSSSTEIRATILIATILMLAALTIAIIASNQLTSPLNYLVTASKRIELGESDFSLTLQRNDEIGQLSKKLNTTTLRLRELLETIENRIDERTANLAVATENIEQQVNQLHSIVEITYKIISIQNLNELLTQITRQISVVFDLYHVGLFLTDPTGRYTILQAANSEGGRKMLEKGYRVKIDQTDRIGYVTSTGKALIVDTYNDEFNIFNNPDLPNTRSEMILPLRIGENIIGVLDLQSDKKMAFKTNNIDNFNMLADQMSIAIQNAQLFEQTQNALSEAQAFYKQSATASWQNVLHQGTKGYRYLNGTTEVINEHSEKTFGQNAEKRSKNNTESLIIPINIRGKSLGILNIYQAGRNHTWSNSEIRVYESIVDRISFALENARLYQDAQRRATKERVISDIATKVSSSVNMDNILQTAVEELGRVIPGSEIVIQLENEDETGAEFRAQE